MHFAYNLHNKCIWLACVHIKTPSALHNAEGVSKPLLLHESPLGFAESSFTIPGPYF